MWRLHYVALHYVATSLIWLGTGHGKFAGNGGHQTNRMRRKFEGSMYKEYESVQNLEGYIKMIRTELVHNCAYSKQNEQK
jgi:hypothetical protein